MVLLLNISYKKKATTQKRGIQLACLLHICRQWRANCIYIIYIKAVVLVILLTFAVTFLLQEDFFLVGTSRA